MIESCKVYVNSDEKSKAKYEINNLISKIYKWNKLKDEINHIDLCELILDDSGYMNLLISESKAEDRIDLLAFKYYGDVTLWWVIAKANHLGKGTLRLEPGRQIRIPRAIEAIMEDFRKLNKDI